MYTVNNFNILFYTIDNSEFSIVNNLNEVDFENTGNLFLDSIDDIHRPEKLGSVFQIKFLNLQSDSPKVELCVNYTGVDYLCTVERIIFNKDVETTLNIVLSRINDIFDERALAFYNSEEWFGSQIYLTMKKKKDYKALADVIEINNIDFKVDSSFRRQHLLIRQQIAV